MGARPPIFMIKRQPATPSLLAETKRLLHQHGLQARKGLAQHFLIDGGALHQIVAAAELTPQDLVLEVGPGLGVLTHELVRRAGWVVAVELDRNLTRILSERLASFKNLTIVNEDILKTDPGKLIAGLDLPPEVDRRHYKVVANLPYYITSAVLRHFLEASAKPSLMVLTIQKEVARTIVAKPGDMSLLSVSVQFYGKPRIVTYIPARGFLPAPEVDSAVLRVDLYPRPPVLVTDERSFFALVRAGFSARRKQLVNALAQGSGKPKAEVLSLLEKAGIPPERRAETLTLEEWARLWGVTCHSGEACPVLRYGSQNPDAASTPPGFQPTLE